MTKEIVKAGAPVMALVPANIDEAFRLSQAIAMSHMAPKIDKRSMTPEEVMATIMAGMEVGLKPMASLRSIALINNRPAFWGDGQLAIVQSCADYAGMDETYDPDTETAHCTVRRKIDGEIEETVRSFSRANAEKANLWGKNGPWQTYPERMLKHRARGWALRDAFSDALMGIMSEVEAKDAPVENIQLITGDIVEDSDEDPTPYEEVDDVDTDSDTGNESDPGPQEDDGEPETTEGIDPAGALEALTWIRSRLEKSWSAEAALAVFNEGGGREVAEKADAVGKGDVGSTLIKAMVATYVGFYRERIDEEEFSKRESGLLAIAKEHDESPMGERELNIRLEKIGISK